jgi:ribonuclease HI
VQLCRFLRFRVAYLYYAAAEMQDERVGAAATIKYRMMTGTVEQQAITETSTCSLVTAELTSILYALEHARDTLRKTAQVYVATTSREALPAIEKGHKVGCGRELVPKVADTVLKMKSVGHRVTVFLVPVPNVFEVLPKQNKLREPSLTKAANPHLSLAEVVVRVPSVIARSGNVDSVYRFFELRRHLRGRSPQASLGVLNCPPAHSDLIPRHSSFLGRPLRQLLRSLP